MEGRDEAEWRNKATGRDEGEEKDEGRIDEAPVREAVGQPVSPALEVGKRGHPLLGIESGRQSLFLVGGELLCLLPPLPGPEGALQEEVEGEESPRGKEGRGVEAEEEKQDKPGEKGGEKAGHVPDGLFLETLEADIAFAELAVPRPGQ